MEERRSILKEAIMVVACRTSETKATQAPLQQLLKEAFNYVENFSSTVPDLSTAVTLTRLMVIFAEKSDSEILHAKIAKIAEGFLKREWYGPDGEREKGAKHNERLQQLLKLHFDHSEDVITSLDDVANLGVKELIQTDKSGCSQTYPTLTRQSFGVFYRMMLSELVSHVKAISPGKLTDSDDEKMERLIRWNMCVRVFHVLVSFIKVFDGRSNLGAIFKYGRQFVEVFLRLAMPLLDNMFSHHGDEVQSLLKNLQISTRSLHHMCGHSKIMKDITLTNQVPPLKKCLEAFVYRVKAMLTLNKCLEAFWMGNLKNRDLQGEEIVSQSTISESQAEESDADNDSVPEDDDDSDVEVGEGSSETTNQEAGSDSDSHHLGSYSETY